jgi:hypothetical protein
MAARKTTPVPAYSAEGCHKGQLELVQIGDPQQLPYVVTSWLPGAMSAAVLHLSQEPSPELVVMLYWLRRALGDHLLFLACHNQKNQSRRRALEALHLTGHHLRGRTEDWSFSVWSGAHEPERLPHLLAPVLRRGDVSNRTASAIVEILPAEARIMEIWPRLGRLSARALHRGDRVVDVVKSKPGARERLLSFLTA